MRHESLRRGEDVGKATRGRKRPQMLSEVIVTYEDLKREAAKLEQEYRCQKRLL